MKVRTRLLGLLAVVALMAGLLPLTAFATQQQEYPTERCYEQVKEVQFKRPILRDEVRYEKFVKGKIEKKVRGIWKVVGTFDWIDWPGAGPLDWGVVPNPMSGSHNSIFDQTGDTRKRSTHFEYQIVDKRQVPTGEYEYSDWMPEGEQPDGDGWEFHEDRTVDGDEIPCACPTDLPIVKATNLNPNGWSVGGATFVNGGIRIDVAGEWQEVSISRAFNKTLRELGDVLDIDATPLQFVGLHFHTSKGVIVYEAEASYGGNLWSKADFGVGSGMGYASFAPLEAYVAAHPDLDVTSVEVLYTHPDPSSTVIASVTFGCQKFIFDFEAQETTTTTSTTTPEETTTTTPEETTTTTVEETTTTTDADSTTTAPTTTPSTLPFTGADTGAMAAVALVLVGLGGLVLALSRKPEEDNIN